MKKIPNKMGETGMNNTLKRAGLALIATAIAVSQVSCSDDSSGGDAKGAVAMSFPAGNVPIWNDTMDEMRKIVEAEGFTFLTDNPDWDIQTQVNDWQSWISGGEVKAIMGMPVQADSMVPVTAEAAAKGIPVLGYASPWEGTADYIELDLKGAGLQVGEAAAAWIAKTYPGEKVGVGVMADTTADLGRLQAEGIKEGLAGANVDVYDFEVNSQDSAYNAAQTGLIAHPEIRVWLSISGAMAMGAREATIDAGYDEKLFYDGATDATDEGYKLIKQGDTMLIETFAFTPDTLGEAMAGMLLQAAKGETVEHKTVGVTHVDASNADKYIK
jgi:ABC-type sugar transport system substrate-binding protein